MAKAATIATRATILSQLRESEESLHAKGLDADTLVAVYYDYLSRKQELRTIAGFVAEMLLCCEKVHAVRYRLKDPLHLLQKIIRKKKEYPHRNINRHNYLHYINDLAGIRVLFLYKEDWEQIGKHIRQLWELKRPPFAYIRHSGELQLFINKGCNVFVHPRGYSAIHFVITTSPDRQRYFIEIQLRTLLEETWSEIDHSIRYPNYSPHPLLDELLLILGRLTSYANETITQIKVLADALNSTAPAPEHFRKVVNQLREYIRTLPIPEAEKQQLFSRINRLL